MDATKIAAAKEAITQANSKNSPLLRLPAELRNKIFAHVSDTVCIVRAAAQNKHLQAHHNGKVLSYICRQIHAEAASIIETPCIMNIHDNVPAPDFSVYMIMALRGENTSLIRAIEMPLKIVKRFQKESAVKVYAGPGIYNFTWNFIFKELSAMFPALRYVVITQDQDGTESIAGKDKDDTDNRKDMLAALRTVFCDGKDTLKMTMRV